MTDRIGEPYELLSLPKPFGGPGSRTQAEAVWQYSSTRIRLRSELVVAVDGEGLYLYDVDNPRLITSYAVSPDTRFSCPPTSLIRKRSDRKLERITYAAVQLKDSQKSRILCFVEERRKQATAELDQPAWKQFEIDVEGTGQSALALLAVPVDLSDLDIAKAINLCVVYKQHVIESYTGDISRRQFVFKREPAKHKESTHEFAATVSLNSLRKGLLKDRQDLAAIIEDTGIDAAQPNILFLIRSDRNMQKDKNEKTIMLARLVGSTSIEEPGSYLKRHGLMKVQRLPKTTTGTATRFELSHDGLQLSAQTDGLLHLWNLTQGFVTNTSSHTEIISHLNLAHSEVLASTADTCSLYNARWQAERARFTVVASDTKTSEKRARDASLPALNSLDFVQYFDSASIVVALSPGALVGIPLSRSSGNKKRRTDMTLADSIGKGETPSSSKAETKFSTFGQQVRELVQNGNVLELEDLVAAQIGLQSHTDQEEAINGHAEGAIAPEKVWSFPNDDAIILRRTDLSKAKIVLRECVGSASPVAGHSSLRLYSDMVFRWLAISGVLSSFGDKSQRGGLMAALADYDSTLAIMETVLRWDFHLDIDEIVQALSIAIDSLDSPIPQQDQLEDDSNNEDAVNQPDDDSVADATQAAEDDLAFAIASLNHGTAIRSGLLKSIFDRLFAFPNSNIVQAFKSMLTPRELVFLINLLRIELADGGWTTRYTDERYEDDLDDGPADNSISIIIKLLNSAIDAVGPTGWNVGLSSDKQLNTDEMLLVLRAEVNAALDGCQEYQAIADTLQDFTKYCALAEPLRHKKKRKVDALWNPGFIKDEAEDVLLPLGARLDRIEGTRVNKGGRVDVKSKNQIGQEISMRVGRYSIDKIRV
ncbi:hypothetical protein BDZ85DRAFT_279543 [Elsinoe ampelina]|uniref:Uncharacterized protein n=1 Tax=Elsinoe ampelina TaxID=302913 RepID=A0A6A6GK60_9PEZI|nr:hypothetical protein BDZ85DRAFT_279543 [Elsinoe ampelina]